MLGARVETVVPVHAIGCTADEFPPARQPAVPRQLRTLGLRLFRKLAAATAAAGIVLIAVISVELISVELAHDLCTRAAGDRSGARRTLRLGRAKLGELAAGPEARDPSRSTRRLAQPVPGVSAPTLATQP